MKISLWLNTTVIGRLLTSCIPFYALIPMSIFREYSFSEFITNVYLLYCVFFFVDAVAFIFQINRFQTFSENAFLEFIGDKKLPQASKNKSWFFMIKEKLTKTVIRRLIYTFAPGLIIAKIWLLVEGNKLDYWVDPYFDYIERFFVVFFILFSIQTIGFIFRIRNLQIFEKT